MIKRIVVVHVNAFIRAPVFCVLSTESFLVLKPAFSGFWSQTACKRARHSRPPGRASELLLTLDNLPPYMMRCLGKISGFWEP